MSIKMRMFSTMANRNGCAVTEAFIDNIAGSAEKYVCIPLCADTRKLKSGDFRHMGHMLDRKTGAFLSEQIGAFSSFEKVEDEYGISLLGEARVAKRNQKVCAALLTLYEAEALNFSFEIIAQETITKDGVTTIDAADGNELIGMAVVSVPAYPEARALEFVAEAEDKKEEAMLLHTQMEMSEVDFETIRDWFFSAIRAALGDDLWLFKIERLGTDFAILYSTRHGKTLKVEFAVHEEGLILTDMYEVIYQRREMVGGENLSEKVARDMEPVEQTLQSATNDNAGVLTPDERDQRISALEKRVGELEPLERENKDLKAKIAEGEAEATRREMREFAAAYNLDVEDDAVKDAIEKMDLMALMAQSTKASKPEAKPVVAAHALSGGIQAEPYGGLLDSE